LVREETGGGEKKCKQKKKSVGIGGLFVGKKELWGGGGEKRTWGGRGPFVRPKQGPWGPEGGGKKALEKKKIP